MQNANSFPPASAVGAPHRRDRVWIIANPRGEQREGDSPPLSGQVSAELSRAASDADEQGLEIVINRDAGKFSTAFGTRQWSAEPDICRVVDGLSYELDIVRRIEDAESCGAQADATSSASTWLLLRTMWEQRETAKTSPELYRRRLHDRVPELPCGDSLSRWLLGKRIEEDEGLRDLWAAFYAEPFEKAQDLQLRVLERARQKKRPQALGSRVDRLKALGNSVVPQIVEVIGRALASQETRRDGE